MGGLFFDDVDAATAGYDVEQVPPPTCNHSPHRAACTAPATVARLAVALPTRCDHIALPALGSPQFVRDVGDGILPSWTPIVERRRGQQFSDAQRQWQLLRRGRCGGLGRVAPRTRRKGMEGWSVHVHYLGRCWT